jgi:hypothetical protein
VRHQRRSGGERLRPAAERVREQQHARTVTLREATQRARHRATEPVHALVVVAHQHHLVAAGHEALQRGELHGIDVLGFVDDRRAPAVAGPREQRRARVQRRPGGHQALVVVEPTERPPHPLEVLQQGGKVGVIGVGRRGAGLGPGGGGQRHRLEAGQFEPGEAAPAVGGERGRVDGAPGLGQVGVEAGSLALGPAHDLGDDGVGRWPRRRGRPADPRPGRQQGVRQRVEGAHIDAGQGGIGLQLAPHRGDRRAGEADHEQVARVAAPGGDPVADAGDHRRGLAGAGHRHHHGRPALVLDHRALGGCQGGGWGGARGGCRRRGSARRVALPPGQLAGGGADIVDAPRPPANALAGVGPQRHRPAERRPLEALARPRQRGLHAGHANSPTPWGTPTRCRHGSIRLPGFVHRHRRLAAGQQRGPGRAPGLCARPFEGGRPGPGRAPPAGHGGCGVGDGGCVHDVILPEGRAGDGGERAPSPGSIGCRK